MPFKLFHFDQFAQKISLQRNQREKLNRSTMTQDTISTKVYTKSVFLLLMLGSQNTIINYLFSDKNGEQLGEILREVFIRDKA